ncbi:Protein O-mannosyltransferase 2, partial [Kappamyces sp. JEL0680]
MASDGLRKRKEGLAEKASPLFEAVADEEEKRVAARVFQEIPEGSWGMTMSFGMKRILGGALILIGTRKFAGYYIKRTFYTDVHPPLGKMLNGFAGLLGGFNGRFEFESGAQYPSEVKYGVMRFFNAIFGAMVTPLAYWTGVHLRFSPLQAALLGVMTITETTKSPSRVLQLTGSPFSLEWFAWLFISGMSLGLVFSVKWVGLFAIALVGLHTIEDLWEVLGDMSLSLKKQAAHLGARIAFLIIVPISVYMTVFVIHFAILNRSGPGDAGMSSLFQAGLAGNNFKDNPL